MPLQAHHSSKLRLVSPPYTGHLKLRHIVELTNRSGFVFSSSVTHRLGGGTFDLRE